MRSILILAVIMLAVGAATCTAYRQLEIDPEALKPPDEEFALPGDKEYELIIENKVRAAQGLPRLRSIYDRDRPPVPFHPED